MQSPQQIFIEEILTKIPKIREAIITLRGEPQNKTCQNILHIFLKFRTPLDPCFYNFQIA